MKTRIDEITAEMRRAMAEMPDGGGEYAYAVGRIRYAIYDGLSTDNERLGAIAEVLLALDLAGESGE